MTINFFRHFVKIKNKRRKLEDAGNPGYPNIHMLQSLLFVIYWKLTIYNSVKGEN